jgi:hypothetical protein
MKQPPRTGLCPFRRIGLVDREETCRFLPEALVESRETFYEMEQPRYSSAFAVSSTNACASSADSNR